MKVREYPSVVKEDVILVPYVLGETGVSRDDP